MKKSTIYTKTGDSGSSSLVGGRTVHKTDIRLEAYGTVDELNSYIGWLRCQIDESRHQDFLYFLQQKLFTVGAYLATDSEEEHSAVKSIIDKQDIEHIEEQIDILDALLPRLDRFILPGGSEAASRAHICRAVTRRAERNLYLMNYSFPIIEEVLAFFNRLSDYFFVLARYEGAKSSKEFYWEDGDI